MRAFRRIVLSATLALLASTAARADIVIDNFMTATPTIIQTGSGTTTAPPVSGSGILGSRDISLTVASPLTAGTASVGISPGIATAGYAGNYSPVNLANNFTLTETFAATNAVAAGTSELSFLIGSSGGTTVTITANGTSTFTFTDPVSPAGISHSILFSSFSNPSVFSSLTSLTFVETFPNPEISGPSVSFAGPIALSAVPEPSPIVLAGLASGLLGAGRWVVRRKRVVA